MGYKIFVDTNIYLNVFLKRESLFEDSMQLLKIGEQDKIEIYSSASILLNCIYMLNRYKIEKTTQISTANSILEYTLLLPCSNVSFQAALQSGFSDLEDAVQYYTALEYRKIDYFITDNVKDFKKAIPILPVITPKKFLEIYS